MTLRTCLNRDDTCKEDLLEKKNQEGNLIQNEYDDDVDADLVLHQVNATDVWTCVCSYHTSKLRTLLFEILQYGNHYGTVKDIK